MATDFTILAPSAGRVAVSWKRMVARCVIKYSWSGTEYSRDTSLATASFTVAISLTASTRAFSHAAGFKDLVVVCVDVLSDPSAGEGMGVVSGWEEVGVCDIACEPVPRTIFESLCWCARCER